MNRPGLGLDAVGFGDSALFIQFAGGDKNRSSSLILGDGLHKDAQGVVSVNGRLLTFQCPDLRLLDEPGGGLCQDSRCQTGIGIRHIGLGFLLIPVFFSNPSIFINIRRRVCNEHNVPVLIRCFGLLHNPHGVVCILRDFPAASCLHAGFFDKACGIFRDNNDPQSCVGIILNGFGSLVGAIRLGNPALLI